MSLLRYHFVLASQNASKRPDVLGPLGSNFSGLVFDGSVLIGSDAHLELTADATYLLVCKDGLLLTTA